MNILVVETEPSSLPPSFANWKKSDFTLTYAWNGEGAHPKVRERDFDLILLDIMLARSQWF